ncbi:MAG: hypothetical protein SFY69_07870 [Planctomycetota bacterium]|nr:hypothetical protein [Planctomycetota bacterium]
MNTNPREEISPERLVEAAVACLRATQEYAAEFGKTIYPTDLLGSPEQPRDLCEFTRYEVEEAAAFLVRMGYIEPRPRATHGL